MKECDPLLLFIDVFDSELKLAILESLYLHKMIELDKLSSLVGAKTSDTFQEIWSLQNHKILLRIDQGTVIIFV